MPNLQFYSRVDFSLPQTYFIITYVKLYFILPKDEINNRKILSNPHEYMVSSCKFILNFALYNFTFDSI